MTELTRLVIADDHAIVREGLRLMVDAIGAFEVVGEASSGTEAVAMAIDLRPDVVLMDIDMPEMDGIDATRRIAEVAPDIRILVLTVHEEDDPIFDAVQAGAAGYVSKSATMYQIAAAIGALGAGGGYVEVSAAESMLRVLTRRAASVLESAAACQNTTGREREILALLADGIVVREIAATLKISERTVNCHLRHIYRRLGVHSRVGAVREAARHGLVALTG